MYWGRGEVISRPCLSERGGKKRRGGRRGERERGKEKGSGRKRRKGERGRSEVAKLLPADHGEEGVVDLQEIVDL